MSSRSSATVDIHQNDQAPVVDPEKDQDGDSKKLQVQVDQQPEDPSAYLVTLSPEEDPKNRSAFRKWLIVVTVSMSALCVTCASSMAAFTEAPVAEEFHIGTEVSILGVSLYVQGLGIAPLLLGPLSELYGRNIVYRASFFLFWVFSWPVAFPPHIAVFLTFRFLTGFSGAAFLSVAGGSVSDLFTNEKLANPMALFTISPFIGPVLGPLVSGFINQHVEWRWTYRVLLIWIFVQLIALVVFVPETYVPILLKWKAQKLRKTSGDDRYYAPVEKQKKYKSLTHAVLMSCYVPFQLLFLDRMALLLDLWNALLLGILYLAFQAFPIIFEQGHHFSIQFTGLTFLGVGVGMLLGLASQPFWNRVYRAKAAKYEGDPPCELHLIMGQAGAVLVPFSLYWLAFTTYPHIHFIVPIIASVPFGAGILLCYTSTWTYLVTAYRPIAASSMAANTFVRTTFAAAFPLFAGQMYRALGTVGATALLAGLTTISAPLPFVFYRIGERLRKNSRFAQASESIQ